MKKIIYAAYFVLPVGAFAMADRSAPVYGRPTLYGEYEINADDARAAALMYGATPKNSAAKMPVKQKVAIPKKAVKKKKAQKKSRVRKAALKQTAADKKPVEMSDVIVVPPRAADVAPIPVEVAPKVEAPAPKPVAKPSAEALSIAESARAVRDENSYCTQRGAPRRGKLPDGFVLMPGRPDLMSCGGK